MPRASNTCGLSWARRYHLGLNWMLIVFCCCKCWLNCMLIVFCCCKCWLFVVVEQPSSAVASAEKLGIKIVAVEGELTELFAFPDGGLHRSYVCCVFPCSRAIEQTYLMSCRHSYLQSCRHTLRVYVMVPNSMDPVRASKCMLTVPSIAWNAVPHRRVLASCMHNE